jgi:hypothetical protein
LRGNPLLAGEMDECRNEAVIAAAMDGWRKA